jgi:XTP/dITP diphosphohydrolase
MKPLLLATTNEGKVREIREVFRGLAVPLRSLNDFPPVPEPEETDPSFEGNARLKARAYASATGVLTVAEDSGLAIDALGGRPGVHSARYPGSTYPEKFTNLFRELADHPRPWTARYVCAIALVDGDQVLFETVATVEGEIWPQPLGSNGFGYDPIFYYPSFGMTFGQVEDARKLAVAHRGKAFGVLRQWIEGGEYPGARS